MGNDTLRYAGVSFFCAEHFSKSIKVDRLELRLNKHALLGISSRQFTADGKQLPLHLNN